MRHVGSICFQLKTLRPRQNGRRFADYTFKRIFLNENVMISIKISLKFVPKVGINNIPALVQIMAWRLPGDKPLSEPTMVRLLMHVCVTRPQCPPLKASQKKKLVIFLWFLKSLYKATDGITRISYISKAIPSNHPKTHTQDISG